MYKENKNAYKIEYVQKSIIILFGLLIVFCFLYIYSLGSVVFAVIERRSAETQTETYRSQIAALEVQYFSQTKDLTLDQALLRGFTKPLQITYKERGIFAFKTDKTNEF